MRPDGQASYRAADARRVVTPLAVAATVAATPAIGCWRIGEPTSDEAIVSWAAYPDTVVTGESFSFEFAGPVSPTTCGRLDTAVVSIGAGEIVLSAERSVFDASCARERVSFYHARPFAIERAGEYQVRTRSGLDLGTLVAVDSGGFSPMMAVGEGTIRSVGGCWLFGPGWASNQRPFALREAPPAVTAEAGTDRVIFMRGAFAGFTLCGRWGSRPSIRVDTAWVTERHGRDYYQ